MKFINAKILDSEFNFKMGQLLVRGGSIARISFGEDIACDDEVCDLQGNMLLPGLIDTHIHGASGCDASDAVFDAVDTISKTLPRHGVTSVMATTVTSPMDQLHGAWIIPPSDYKSGAEVLGYHMEGPYINVEFKGAHRPECIIPPDIEVFKRYPHIKMVTVAPETPGGMDFIEEAAKTAAVCVGHTGAKYEMALEAFKRGASNVTHLFNAMPPIRHRDPGVIGAAFDSGVFVQLIHDGVHIHPCVLRAAHAMFGRDRITMISDAMRAAGLKEDDYTLGGQRVIVKGGVATLADGTIAGSVCLLWGGVSNAVKFGIPLENAVKTASYNPAKAVGLENRIGSIAEGHDADLIVADESMEIKAVYLKGKLYD